MSNSLPKKNQSLLPLIIRSASQEKLRPLMRINKNSIFPKDFFNISFKTPKQSCSLLPKLLSSSSQTKLKKDKQALPKANARFLKHQRIQQDPLAQEDMNFTFGQLKIDIQKAKSFASIRRQLYKGDYVQARQIKTECSAESNENLDNQNNQNFIRIIKQKSPQKIDLTNKKLKRKALRV